MKKLFSIFSFLLTIISISISYSQIDIDEKDLSEIKGKLYHNNNLFSGNATYYDSNQLIREIVEIKNGLRKGKVRTYYTIKNYNKRNYKDSILIRDIENMRENQKALVNKLLEDTADIFIRKKEFLNDTIGGLEKWARIKLKYEKNSLNGKKYELVQKYLYFDSLHIAKIRVYNEENNKLLYIENEISIEKSKPLLIQKTFEDFHINNEFKDGYYTAFFENGNIKLEGMYLNGKRIGNWKEYSDNGKIENEVNYGETTGTISDSRDGKIYKTVVIGTQTWMAENLNVSKFRNGDPIPEAKTKEEWLKAGEKKQPAWCYLDNDSLNGNYCGKLFNWFACNDPRGLAPEGWHIPHFNEWRKLEDFLGTPFEDNWTTYYGDVGIKLKSKTIKEINITYEDVEGYYREEKKWIQCTNCSYWTENQRKYNPCSFCKNKKGRYEINSKYIPKTKQKNETTFLKGFDGSNESGFSGLPCGERWWNGKFDEEDLKYFTGYNYSDRHDGTWWSYSGSKLEGNSWEDTFSLSSHQKYLSNYPNSKSSGYSIRCIKD
jgi:uncharacterized protein (TIGR02145 family)